MMPSVPGLICLHWEAMKLGPVFSVALNLFIAIEWFTVTQYTE